MEDKRLNPLSNLHLLLYLKRYGMRWISKMLLLKSEGQRNGLLTYKAQQMEQSREKSICDGLECMY
jgi:hypothetical protein